MDLNMSKDSVIVEKETLDTFFPKIGDFFQAICLNNGVIGALCPNNKDSLCGIKCTERPRFFYHVWDGKNAWRCPCG